MNYNINPLGRIGKGRSSKPLTPCQKSWICEEISACRETPISIQRKWGIDRKSISHWYKMHCEGKMFNDRVGRPPILDEKNLDIVREKLTEREQD